MNILVLGTFESTSTLLVQFALNQGHQVTALVPDVGALTMEDPSLRLVVGDVRDVPTVERAVVGQDAVFLLVDSDKAAESCLRTEAARSVVTAMRGGPAKRLIALSGLGAGITRKARGFLFEHILARTLFKTLLDDQNGMESAIRKSLLDWIVVRPGKLLDGPPTGKWVLSMEGVEISENIPRADVVMFLLSQLQNSEFIRKPVAIGTADA